MSLLALAVAVVLGPGVALLSGAMTRRCLRRGGDERARRMTLVSSIAGLTLVAAVWAWAIIAERHLNVTGVVWLTLLALVFMIFGAVALRRGG